MVNQTEILKRVIVICEGPTEQEFCKDVLRPYLFTKNILLDYPLIKKSGGGIVQWNVLKSQVENHLKTEPAAKVSLLIDYYGIKERHLFPKWQESHSIINKNERMNHLEESMRASLSDDLSHKFIPYLQLHEFEGLLFSDLEVFKRIIPEQDFTDYEELESIIERYPNPELINDSFENAPSYRLQRIIKGYNKIVFGAILAQEIGLDKICSKCPRFRHWLNNLENI